MKLRVAFALCLLGRLSCAAEVPCQDLEKAADYSAGKGEISLLVWQRGRVIYERHETNANSPARVYSITKSLVSIGIFRAMSSGVLSLSQQVRYPVARGAVVRDLLNQTSGLPPASREFYSQGLQDKARVLTKLKRAGGSGSFAYGPSHWEVLAEEVKMTQDEPLDRWLRRFVPGAGSTVIARWRRDDQGRIFFSTGARMNARDLLPAGREVLHGYGQGRWPHEVCEMLAHGTPANRMYALGFWLNRGALQHGAQEIDVESSLGRARDAVFWQRGCLSRSAPPDLVAMIGSRGQRVYVVPSLELVVIRLGNGSGFSDAEFLRRLFAQRV